VFLALGMQRAMRMRHIFSCGLSRSTILFHIKKGKIFGKKLLLNMKRVFHVSLQLPSETFLILRRNERDMIKKMYIGLHVKYLLFLSDLKLEFSRKILKYQIL